MTHSTNGRRDVAGDDRTAELEQLRGELADRQRIVRALEVALAQAKADASRWKGSYQTAVEEREAEADRNELLRTELATGATTARERVAEFIGASLEEPSARSSDDQWEAALEAHYAAHPDARPSLAEIAQALAVQMGSPLAGRLDLLVLAAAAMTAAGLDPDPRDVVVWVTAQAASRQQSVYGWDELEAWTDDDLD